LPQAELEDAQRMMSTNQYEAEFLCSFEAAIVGAFYGQEMRRITDLERITTVDYDPMFPCHTVWDLGVGKNLAIGFYQATMNERRMIDYWEGDVTDGIQQASLMLQKKGYLYGSHFAPHDIQAKEISTGKTRLDTAREFGINFQIVPSVGVENGIDKGRLYWSKLWVDAETCSHWLDALSQYRQQWDDKKGCFIEKPVHDWTSHPVDVHRYASLVQDLMLNSYGELKTSY